MTSQPYRYEFRTFSPDLRAMESAIRTYASLSRYRESHEIYLLLPGRRDLNLKIRDDAFELKSLHHRYRDIEQWRPTFRLEFPIQTSKLQDHLQACLPCEDIDWEAGTLCKTELVERMRQTDINALAVSLFKKRSGFEIADCQVEIVEVYINGAVTMSVAIESPQAESVSAMRDRLKLNHLANTGYPSALERVLGRLPLESGVFYNAFAVHGIEQGPDTRHALRQVFNG